MDRFWIPTIGAVRTAGAPEAPEVRVLAPPGRGTDKRTLWLVLDRQTFSDVPRERFPLFPHFLFLLPRIRGLVTVVTEW